jgi:hypothetical protein
MTGSGGVRGHGVLGKREEAESIGYELGGN